jgi:hypothetical protein
MRTACALLTLLHAGAATSEQKSCRAPAPSPGPPGPSPPPGPRPKGHDPDYYESHIPLAPGVTLHATLHPLMKTAELLLQAEVPAGKTINWLGLGVSPDGKMGGGSFMMGWGAPAGSAQEGCVVASTLPVGGASGAPTGPASFPMTHTGFAVYEGYAFLQVERPLRDNDIGHSSIPLSGPLHVLYAAGSTAPTSCTAKPEPANYHDVYHASALIQIKPPNNQQQLLPAFRSAAPAAVAPPNATRHPPARFVKVPGATVEYQHPEFGYTIVEDTIESQSYFLKDGDVVFTQFSETILPMPTGDYAVLSLVGGLVDCNNVSVPLDVVYNHHWLMKPISGMSMSVSMSPTKQHKTWHL